MHTIMIVDWLQFFVVYFQNTFSLGVIGRDLIHKLLEDVAVAEPYNLVPFFVSHQPLFSRNPNFSPPLILHDSFLTNVLNFDVLATFIAIINLLSVNISLILVGSSLIFFSELGIEGLKCLSVVIVSIIDQFLMVDEIIDGLRIEMRQEMNL